MGMAPPDPYLLQPHPDPYLLRYRQTLLLKSWGIEDSRGGAKEPNIHTILFLRTCKQTLFHIITDIQANMHEREIPSHFSGHKEKITIHKDKRGRVTHFEHFSYNSLKPLNFRQQLRHFRQPSKEPEHEQLVALISCPPE